MNDLHKKESSYPFVVDYKPGFFLSWFLYKLFKRVKFDPNVVEDIKQMNRQGTVVYAIKYKGGLDYLLYHYRFRSSRLPYPKIAFGLNMSLVLPLSQLYKVLKFQISHLLKNKKLPNPYESGFLKTAIREGVPSLICLIDPKGFVRRFVHSEKDNIQFLLETQKEMTRPIYLLPQLILYKMSPERESSKITDILFGFKDNPGLIRKTVLFYRHNQKAFIDFGMPMDLKAYLESQPPNRSMDEMVSEVREMLIGTIDKQKRIILGPIMKSRQELKEKVLTDPEITQSIATMGAKSKKALRQTKKKADEYFDEIAADYHIAYVHVFQIVLTWLWKKVFEGIDVKTSELSNLREWARKGPVIYVPSHKSHIDYMVINYVLFQHHMHIPRIAAGKNLAFWPMGHIFRKAGAFFIRRSFLGARLYSKVFVRYIKALLEEGHPLEFYLEGGRSRNGKLIFPKVGLLTILLEAFKEGYCDDLIFAPASINYDRIIEEKSYLKEVSGGEKEQENFMQVLRARHFLKRRYGKIYIRFGQPFSLKEYLSGVVDSESEGGYQTGLALHIIKAINRATLVTPLSLVATTILSNHRRGFHISELMSTSKYLLQLLEECEAPIASTLSDLEKAVEETLALLMSWKIVSSLEDVEDAENFYFVEDDKKREIEYYKNCIIHFFISEAYVAVSLLADKKEAKTVDMIVEDFVFLKNLLRNEFFFDQNENIQEIVETVLNRFLDNSFITKIGSEDTYRLTMLGLNKLQIFSALVKTFIESYWIALRSFLQKEGKTRKKGDLLKHMNYSGTRYHKLGLIDHIESISQINFQNAIQVVNEDVLKKKKGQKTDSSDIREKLSQISQRLYELGTYNS